MSKITRSGSSISPNLLSDIPGDGLIICGLWAGLTGGCGGLW